MTIHEPTMFCDGGPTCPGSVTACAWCGRAIAKANRPTLDGAEWFCSAECEQACDGGAE